MEGDVKGREAISVEPDRRLAVIGPASASRCKVGLLVFHWLLPSVACVKSWKNASLLGDSPPSLCLGETPKIAKCNFSEPPLPAKNQPHGLCTHESCYHWSPSFLLTSEVSL